MGSFNVLDPHSCVYVLKVNTVETLCTYYVYVLVVNYIVVIYVQKSQVSYFTLFQFLE